MKLFSPAVPITGLVLIFLSVLANSVSAGDEGVIGMGGSTTGFIEELSLDRNEYRFSSADMLTIGDAVAKTTIAAEPEGTSLDAISRKMNNPVSDLWMLTLQQDFMQFDGDVTTQDRQIFVTTFQPVIAVPLGDQWNLVNRPVFTFIDAELPKLSSGGAGLALFPADRGSVVQRPDPRHFKTGEAGSPLAILCSFRC